jgi:hypothetical protein
VCRFWDVAAAAWSTLGCRLHAQTPTTVVCACTHLTAFSAAKLFVPPLKSITAVEAQVCQGLLKTSKHEKHEEQKSGEEKSGNMFFSKKTKYQIFRPPKLDHFYFRCQLLCFCVCNSLRPSRPPQAVFTWEFLVEHPFPMAVAFGLLLLGLGAAISLAVAEGDIALCGGNGSAHDTATARRLYTREDFDADGKVVRGCFDRAAYQFYFSTEETVDVIRRALIADSIPSEDEFSRDEMQCGAWLCDSRLWAVYRSSVAMYLLRQHHLLSIWFHHPFDVRNIL